MVRSKKKTWRSSAYLCSLDNLMVVTAVKLVVDDDWSILASGTIALNLGP
jgi:hypothetical protein